MNDMLRVALIALRGVWVHRWLGMGVAWGTAVLAFVVIAILPSFYEGSARLFVETESVIGPLMQGMTVVPNEEARVQLLSRILVSRPNVEKLVQTVGLEEPGTDRERVVDDVMKRIAVKTAGKDNIYTLSFRDRDPVRAKEGVAALARMFVESSKGGKAADTDTAKRFIEDQIVVYEKRLEEAENRLKEFKLQNLGLTPPDGRDYFARMADAERALTQSRLELREAERARDAFRRGLAEEGISSGAPASPSASAAAAAATLSDIDARLEAQNKALDALLTKYTEGHPDVAGTRRIIGDLKEQRAKVATQVRSAPASATALAGSPRATETLKVSLAQAEAQVASLTQRVADYTVRYETMRASAVRIPKLEADLVQLNRDYDINKKNYDSLVARRESAALSGEMQNASNRSNFRLVDPPRVSPRPVTPNQRLLVPFALLLSLAAGIAAAWIAHEVRPRFFDGRDLRETTALPLLGIVSALVTPESVKAERRARLRFAGAAAALVMLYTTGLVVFELMASKAV